MTDAEKIEALGEHIDKLELENAGLRTDVRGARAAQGLAELLRDVAVGQADAADIRASGLLLTLGSQEEYKAGVASRAEEVMKLYLEAKVERTKAFRWERLARKYAKAINAVYHTVNMEDAFGYREDGPITVDGDLAGL